MKKPKTPRMPRSNCRHCLESFWIQGGKIIDRCFTCELDEWDPMIGCRKGQCHYYGKARNEAKKGGAR